MRLKGFASLPHFDDRKVIGTRNVPHHFESDGTPILHAVLGKLTQNRRGLVGEISIHINVRHDMNRALGGLLSLVLTNQGNRGEQKYRSKSHERSIALRHAQCSREGVECGTLLDVAATHLDQFIAPSGGPT